MITRDDNFIPIPDITVRDQPCRSSTSEPLGSLGGKPEPFHGLLSDEGRTGKWRARVGFRLRVELLFAACTAKVE